MSAPPGPAETAPPPPEPARAADVRVLVQEEGRAARNLLVFNVLVDNKSPGSVLRTARRQPASARSGRPGPPEERPPARAAAATAARKRGRARSVSAGRGSAKDLHARYWTFLFENLRRAVDEIYQTCETDDSVLECKETIMILERCTQDFRNLIEWLKIKWEYDHTPRPQRPASVAWEVRKTSPGKLPLALVERRLMGEHSRKQLAFEERLSPRPDSASPAARPEPDAAVGRQLEQELRSALASPETAGEPPPPEEKEPPPPQQPLTETAPEAAQRPARAARAAGRPRGGRQVTSAAAGRGRPGVSPRGGRPGAAVAAPGGGARPEQKTVTRPGQISAPAGRGTTTSSTSSRPVAASRRSSRGGLRPSHPPPAARSAAARVSPRPGLQRSATVCSSGPAPPPPAQLYSSCVASRSNSSLSSTASSSGHSWADRVRGVAAPGPAGQAAAAAPAAGDGTAAAAAAADDDGGGWETVKGRSRSRLSSGNHQGQARAPLQRKGSAEATCGASRPYSARSRYQQPTSAVSLPSLAGPSLSQRGPERRPSGVSERAARRAAASRPAPPPPPPPAQADSQALRRSRERVPGQGGEKKAARTAAKQRRTAPPQREVISNGHSAPPSAAPGTGDVPPPASSTEESATASPSSPTAAAGADSRDGRTDAAAATVTTASAGTGEVTAVVSESATVAGSEAAGATEAAAAGLSVSIPAGDPAEPAAPSPAAAGPSPTPPRDPPAVPSPPPTEQPSSPAARDLTLPPPGDPVPSSSPPDRESLTSPPPPCDPPICPPPPGPLTSPPRESLTSPPPPRDPLTSPPPRDPLTSPPPRDPLTSPPPRDSLTSPPPRDPLTSPPPRDPLTSPDPDEDSVDEEMVRAERALQSAIVQEQRLERQLAETESCVIEVDTETDGDSTSIDTSETEGDGGPGSAPPSRGAIEEQYATELESLSWGDRMELLEALEELQSRPPGRGLQMHQKLSSPSRKKALSETIRLHQERQQKASRMRRSLMDQKTQKLSEISVKIEEVRQQKEQLLEQRRLVLKRKMARAEEKRRKHLQDIVRRAHDEEEKAKEIAFINELEAKNKRHEFYSQIQTQEARLAGIQEERQRRLEEKAAKEAAVEEKRRVLEQERRVKLEELRLKRKERLERIHREQRDKEKERLEMAREKQRDRDERLSALHAAQQATAEELQRRIQQKQEDSARRHEENMVQIRQRALELSVRSAAAGGDDTAAQLAPYDTKKMCTLCNVLIGSEVYLLSHLRGRQHQEAVRTASGSDLTGEDLLVYNLRHITDAAPQHILNMSFDRERHKTLRKRCKKIKARMVARQQEYSLSSQPRPPPSEAPHRAKLLRSVKELGKVLAGQGCGPWPSAAVSALDRTLGEVMRVMDKGCVADQTAFCAAGGLRVLSDIIALIQEELTRDVEIVPARTVSNVSRALAAACRHHPDNCLHMVNSNMAGAALDLLMTRLTRLSSCAASGGVGCDPGAAALMQLTAVLLAALTGTELSHQRWALLQDVLSYLVCVGTVDKISSFFSCVQGGPDSEPHLADFLTQSLRLLRAMAALLTARHPQSTQSKEPVDRTGLVATLQVTQLCGIVSLLYGALLRHHSPAQRRATPPPPLDQATVLLAAEALNTLLQLARLDLHMFQLCLGFEGRSVEFRHVTSYLLWYCSHHDHPDLLRLVIQTTGYFAAGCYDNQMVIQKGNMPTVLQQLLTLPLAHFSDPALTAVLFPTLLACCRDNAQTRAILEQELSFQILEDFLEQESSRGCHLVRVLLAEEEAGSERSGSVASSA